MQTTWHVAHFEKPSAGRLYRLRVMPVDKERLNSREKHAGTKAEHALPESRRVKTQPLIQKPAWCPRVQRCHLRSGKAAQEPPKSDLRGATTPH